MNSTKTQFMIASKMLLSGWGAFRLGGMFGLRMCGQSCLGLLSRPWHGILLISQMLADSDSSSMSQRVIRWEREYTQVRGSIPCGAQCRAPHLHPCCIAS